jgi:hypothetical protein
VQLASAGLADLARISGVRRRQRDHIEAGGAQLATQACAHLGRSVLAGGLDHHDAVAVLGDCRRHLQKHAECPNQGPTPDESEPKHGALSATVAAPSGSRPRS